MSAASLPDERVEAAMREALDLAARGVGRVEPNPPVGAVVLDASGAVVGRGYHEAYADPHAEPNALADAGEAARGGTLVVTLEPCAHVANAHTAKKTPPCVRAIVAAGVQRVVAACPDPNPQTRGRAARALRSAGIRYDEGVLSTLGEARIGRYVANLGSDVPWTVAKWAMSIDGRIADTEGGARWITGPEARGLVHEIRARVEAVIVGRGTVEADDPMLTSRTESAVGRPPALRVVLDSGIRIPTYARLVTGARETPTLVICGADAPVERRRMLEDQGVEIDVVAVGADGRIDLAEAARALRARGVRRALLESGGQLAGAALRAGIVRQVMAFVAPVIIGGRGAPSPFDGDGWSIAAAPRLEEARVREIGPDALLEGFWPSGG